MQMLRTSSDPLASVWRFLPCFFLVFHSQIGMMISSWRIFLAGFSKNKQPIDRLLIGRLLCHGWIWTDLFFYFKMFGWHELFVLCWNKQSMGWKRTLHKAVKCWAVRTSVRGLSIRISIQQIWDSDSDRLISEGISSRAPLSVSFLHARPWSLQPAKESVVRWLVG